MDDHERGPGCPITNQLVITGAVQIMFSAYRAYTQYKMFYKQNVIKTWRFIHSDYSLAQTVLSKKKKKKKYITGLVDLNHWFKDNFNQLIFLALI